MDARLRRRGLLAAALLLTLLEIAIRRFDLFTPLVPDTLPQTLFAAVNSQVIDVVRALRPGAEKARPIVLLGNSQMDLGSRPLPLLRDELVRAGAPADTRVLPLFVYASTLTDAEVITRSIDALHPRLVLLGVSAPDVATSPERARGTPVARILDVGVADGLLPPADLEARLDRWVRTASELYRYRTLFSDLLLPTSGPRVPRSFGDQPHSKQEFLDAFAGGERARQLAALRPGFERGEDWDAVARYVDALQGPAYLLGLRDRWRSLAVEPIQLAAIERFAANVRAAGAQPVIVLVPENPLLERDPEIGSEVRHRSDEAAAALEHSATLAGVETIDLRRGFEPAGFLDLNHLFYQHGGLAPRLADELRTRGLLPAADA